MTKMIIALLACLMGGCALTPTAKMGRLDSEPPAPRPAKEVTNTGDAPLNFGSFSVSLAVKDLAASRAFCEKLGFRQKGGDPTKNWIILQNETSTIGLFQGMFEKNILTFNPGWDRSAGTLPQFDDVRDIQKTLKNRGISMVLEADEAGTGPASFMIVDPDGNQILVDQHVPRPGK